MVLDILEIRGKSQKTRKITKNDDFWGPKRRFWGPGTDFGVWGVKMAI